MVEILLLKPFLVHKAFKLHMHCLGPCFSPYMLFFSLPSIFPILLRILQVVACIYPQLSLHEEMQSSHPTIQDKDFHWQQYLIET